MKFRLSLTRAGYAMALPYLFALFLTCWPANIVAQILTKSVRGKVYDAVTREALFGATVVVVGTDPVIGTMCDVNGHFELPGIPVGRHTIQVSMLGYESYLARELMVSTGKINTLEIALQQSYVELNDVAVTVSKDVPLNTMTTLSARQFTVEETERYAGGLDDPSRLASSFAGVAAPSVTTNGISVRGNSPQGVLWRVEGVEVPSPSHFANLNISGGGMFTVLSNQMLANSDFYTGAFPAEYGNASSGVFDIRLKTGNTTEREYTISAGLIGMDIASEGPFKKGGDASYAINYRYSTLGLMAPVMPDDVGLVDFQDLSFKTVFPTKKAGTFSLWGLSAKDKFEIGAADSANWKTVDDMDDVWIKMYLYAAGLNHRIQVGESTFVNTTVSASGNGVTHQAERVGLGAQKYIESKIANNEQHYTLQSAVNQRFSPKHTSRTGFYYNHLRYNIDVQQAEPEGPPLLSLAKGQGQADFIQFYTQSRIQPNAKLTLNLGVHYQQFLLNNDYSIEPRAGIKYQVTPSHSVAAAYGRHSRLEPLQIYFADHNGTAPNKDLNLMKSNHYVLSYEWKLSDIMRLKIEPYYQYLTDVPVAPEGYVSTLNIDENLLFNDALINKGTGRNIGVDFTLERFLSNGFYYLLTASVFDAKFTAADGVERNTRYNKNYVFNALVGKEWMLGKADKNVFGVNLRMNYLGGNRLEPVDEEASLLAQEVIHAETNGRIAFDERTDDLPVLSFGISYRKNKEKYASVWSLQVINVTQSQEFVHDYYNIKNQSIEQRFIGIMVPNLSYKIEF